MPSVRKKWAQNKQNYLRNKENRREASRTKYGENSDKERADSQASDKKGQPPRLVTGRTLSPKGHLPGRPPIPVTGRTLRQNGHPPILIIERILSPKGHLPGHPLIP